MKKLLVRMPDETYNALRSVSDFDGTSMNQLAIDGIQRVLGDFRKRSVKDVVDEAQVRYADVLEKLKDL